MRVRGTMAVFRFQVNGRVPCALRPIAGTPGTVATSVELAT